MTSARRAVGTVVTTLAAVALLAGCAQQVLAPEINTATIRLLTRLGCEVVIAKGAACCGSLNHHMGQHAPAMALARAVSGYMSDEQVRQARQKGVDLDGLMDQALRSPKGTLLFSVEDKDSSLSVQVE